MKNATIVKIILWAFYVIFGLLYIVLSALYAPKYSHLGLGIILGMISATYIDWLRSFKINQD